MSARDRLMLIGIAVLALLGGVWILAVSPARQQASKASDEVASARSQLSQAQAEADEARSAQQRYRGAYASLASLGQAVPTSPEVPSLVYALDQAANRRKVEFSSITASGASGGAASSASGSSASSVASSPFTQMPFTFTFTGSYQDLIHLLTQLEDFTVQSTVGKGTLKVNGRLLTIQTIALGGGSGSSSSSSAASSTSAKPQEMTWTITASAYVLAPTATAPASGSPAGGSGSGGSSPAGGAPAAAATPAVIRANG